MLTFSSHIDKMNVSYHMSKSISDLLPPVELFEVVSEMRPFAYYSQAYRLRCGGIVNLSDSAKQGARLDLGGQALKALRLEGIDDIALLEILSSSSQKKRTTRVDFCINVHGEDAHPRDTLAEWDGGRRLTRLRSEPEIDDRDRGGQGFTVYYGARESKRRVAIYDKAAELKMLSDAWTRVELRLKKPFAGAFVGDALMYKNTEVVGRSYLLDVLDFPSLGWWGKMVAGDTIYPRDTEQKPDGYRLFLENSVFPAIVKRLTCPQDRDFTVEWAAKVIAAAMEAGYDATS